MILTNIQEVDMGEKIIVCGCNGAGKSTLGPALAKALGCVFKDIEDYYFPDKTGGYAYGKPRTREQAAAALLADMKRHSDMVLAAVKGNYGNEAASQFTAAVFLHTPKEVRMHRVRDRSFQKFGERMLPGGDLYESENAFFSMVEKRTEEEISLWLSGLNIPVIHADGTKPAEENAANIARHFHSSSITERSHSYVPVQNELSRG